MAQQPDLSPAGVLETPYLRAQAEWDGRIGSARVQARNWRLACFISLGLSLFLASGAFYFAGQVRVLPYVIEVADSGQVRKVGRLEAVHYEPMQATVQYLLGEWVRWVRAISSDAVVVRRHWEQAYHFVTPKAANLLSAYARKIQPFDKVGEMAVTVEIANILVLSERSYEVHWVEELFDREGTPVSKTRYSGVFHFMVKLPEDDVTLAHNPLGLYIDAFHWSRSRL